MATYTIEFSVADEHMDKFIAALRKHFGPIHDNVIEEITNLETGQIENFPRPVSRDRTPEELMTKVRQMSVDNIKNIIISFESSEAIAAARSNAIASIDSIIV